MSKHDKSRRSFIKAGAAGLVAVPVAGLGWTSVASAAEPLDPNSPEAQALGYMTVSNIEGQQCIGCLLYNDPTQQEMGPCAVFPGSLVMATGHCTAFVPRG